MPDYKQGKIYTVGWKTDDTLIYVGCIAQSFCERMAKHEYDSMKRPNIQYLFLSTCWWLG